MNSADEHRADAPDSVQAFVLTVSDTRRGRDDISGDLICSLLEAQGHRLVDRRVVPDEVPRIQAAVRAFAARSLFALILVTGGTGISVRDVTMEAVRPLFDKELPGFGELFRFLSFQQIGAAAMLSRASAGIVGRCVLFAMPGSRAAVSLAMSEIILPQANHLVYELRKHAPRE